MTEESKTVAVVEDPVARLLDLQARYGMDQETMLIYMSSLNLMSILNLISRRCGGGANLSAVVPAAPGGALSLENLAGMLMKMLGNQGAGAPGGPALNPAMLMSLLSALGGQNMDLGGLINTLAGMMNSGARPASKPAAAGAHEPAPAAAGAPGGGAAGKAAEKAAGEGTAVKREVPKIMKWDQLDERKKTQDAPYARVHRDIN